MSAARWRRMQPIRVIRRVGSTWQMRGSTCCPRMNPQRVLTFPDGPRLPTKTPRRPTDRPGKQLPYIVAPPGKLFGPLLPLEHWFEEEAGARKAEACLGGHTRLHIRPHA